MQFGEPNHPRDAGLVGVRPNLNARTKLVGRPNPQPITAAPDCQPVARAAPTGGHAEAVSILAARLGEPLTGRSVQSGTSAKLAENREVRDSCQAAQNLPLSLNKLCGRVTVV